MIVVPLGLRSRIGKFLRLRQTRFDGACTTPPGPKAGGSGWLDGGVLGGGPAAPVGENTVRWVNVALPPAGTLNDQLRPAPLSCSSGQRHVFGNGLRVAI